ncbi:MAG: DUF4386 domain-containing protein [Candidatus Sulfotelmatobacter sp.]
MNSTKKAARVAGALYVLNSVPGFVCLQYVPGKLIVSGNATATASNILASERLFRFSIACELIGVTTFVFVVWALLPGLRNPHFQVCGNSYGRGIADDVLAFDYGREGSTIGRHFGMLGAGSSIVARQRN